MKAVKLLAILSFILVLFSGCSQQQKIDQNKAIATSFIEAWSNRNVDKLTSLFAENSSYEEVATGRIFKDKEDIAKYVKGTLAGIPDSKFVITDVHAGPNSAFIEWIWKGTNTVGWAASNIPATNKHIKLRGASIMDIRNGMIYRNRDYWDMNSFLNQLGLK